MATFNNGVAQDILSTKAPLILKWFGPYTLKDFLLDKRLKEDKSDKGFDGPGVYLWVENLDHGEDRLSYVGKASGHPSLYLRQQQHYASLVGGLYRVPKEFRSNCKEWIPDWDLQETVEVMTDPLKFKQLIDDAFLRADKIKVYLCPLKDSSNVASIERNLLYDLQPTGTKRGTGSLPKERLFIKHESPKWFSKTICDQVKDKNIFLINHDL